MSEDAYAAEVVARLTTRLGALTTPRAAYSIGDVPTPLPTALPTAYVEVSISRRFVDGTPRYDGSKSYKGWRLVTRAVATSDANARMLLQLVDEELEFKPLFEGDAATGPLEFETGSDVLPDDGWFSGDRTWTFTD